MTLYAVGLGCRLITGGGFTIFLSTVVAAFLVGTAPSNMAKPVAMKTAYNFERSFLLENKWMFDSRDPNTFCIYGFQVIAFFIKSYLYHWHRLFESCNLTLLMLENAILACCMLFVSK